VVFEIRFGGRAERHLAERFVVAVEHLATALDKLATATPAEDPPDPALAEAATRLNAQSAEMETARQTESP
jgi:hypothetical protein